MTGLRSTWRASAAVLLSSIALSACVVTPLGYYDDYGNGESIAVADVPPPAPYYEVRPALPFVGAVWISGYWGWNGGRHVWVPGRWDHGRPGYVWQPHRWVPNGGRWNLYGGGWRRGR
jgi:hypothetical protein